MKTQIVLSSFVAASLEVLPVVIQWPPAIPDESAGDDLIDWLAGLSHRSRPARRLPGSRVGFRLLANRAIRHSNYNVAQQLS